VHWFIGDDRFVPQSHPLSNMGKARQLFLDRVPVPGHNIHQIETDATDPDGAARRPPPAKKRRRQKALPQFAPES